MKTLPTEVRNASLLNPIEDVSEVFRGDLKMAHQTTRIDQVLGLLLQVLSQAGRRIGLFCFGPLEIRVCHIVNPFPTKIQAENRQPLFLKDTVSEADEVTRGGNGSQYFIKSKSALYV